MSVSCHRGREWFERTKDLSNNNQNELLRKTVVELDQMQATLGKTVPMKCKYVEVGGKSAMEIHYSDREGRSEWKEGKNEFSSRISNKKRQVFGGMDFCKNHSPNTCKSG